MHMAFMALIASSAVPGSPQNTILPERSQGDAAKIDETKSASRASTMPSTYSASAAHAKLHSDASGPKHVSYSRSSYGMKWEEELDREAAKLSGRSRSSRSRYSGSRSYYTSVSSPSCDRGSSRSSYRPSRSSYRDGSSYSSNRIPGPGKRCSTTIGKECKHDSGRQLICGRVGPGDEAKWCFKDDQSKIIDGQIWCQNAEGSACSDGIDFNCQDGLYCGGLFTLVHVFAALFQSTTRSGA